MESIPDNNKMPGPVAHASDWVEVRTERCTQPEDEQTDDESLIRSKPDVLPREFELATHYMLGICTQAKAPALARKFAAMLAGQESIARRRQTGFEFS
jgi:hypothetical protein